jgi:RHS repeat-associated protein
LADGLGSVRQLSDASGNIVQSYTYAPFGELLAAQGTRPSALQYTGEQKDVDTGLVYLRARWYDSATGRFTTRDPFPGFAVLPQTLHPYVYVNNNPVNLTDPSGKFAFLPLLVVAILGGIIGGVSYYTIQAVLNADPCLGVQWHWQEALFWGGSGGVIGGLLGTAAYGTWWIWVHLGSGAAVCAANQSCRNAIGNAAQSGKKLLDSVSKLDARAALQSGIEGLSNGQVQKALEVLRSGRIDSFSMTLLENGQLQIITQRAGTDGFQRLIYTLDPSGKTIGLIQQAYNAAGELVHVHDKLNNAIIK